jgi:hypothetical protein
VTHFGFFAFLPCVWVLSLCTPFYPFASGCSVSLELCCQGFIITVVVAIIIIIIVVAIIIIIIVVAHELNHSLHNPPS